LSGLKSLQTDGAVPGLNRLVLKAVLVERGALRYTPAGLPVLDLSLKHESELMHNGQIRRIALEIKARGIGDITSWICGLFRTAAQRTGCRVSCDRTRLI
jgi:primosomal replication protein N